jgi:hypothetical protein
VSVTASWTGDGVVNYKENILYAPNGLCVYMYSGSYKNKAEITATLNNAPVSGQLYLKCSTPTATGANLKVYVCNTNGVWSLAKEKNVYPQNTVIDVDCGYVANVVKVSIVAYHEFYINGVYYPSYLAPDAVWVVWN